jgi:hypothetical protein
MAKKRRPVGDIMGGMIVGFDQQVFRTTRPIPELIEAAKPLPPVPASGGGHLSVELPDAGPADPGAPDSAPDP